MGDCKMSIKIGSGAVYDIGHYDFHLGKSPSELGCDIKESNFVITDFPEEDGVDVYIPIAPSKKEFDYPITLIYFTESIDNANAAITSFYNALQGKKITIYNYFKRVMIVGYVKAYKNVEFYRQEKDVVTFELTFFIPKPQDCNFNLEA